MFSAFTPRVEKDPVIYVKPEEDLVTREIQEKIEPVDGSKGDFITVPTVVETKRINRQEYIQSFADDCGIVALMKKFEQFQDAEIFNQTIRHPQSVDENGVEAVIDLTKIPDDPYAGAMKIAEAKRMLNGLDQETRNLIINGTNEEIAAYIAGLVKEGGNENE